MRHQVQWHQDKEKPAEKRSSHDRREARTADSETGFWFIAPPKYNSIRTIELDDSMIALLQREKERQAKDEPYYDEYYFHYYKDFRGRLYKRQGRFEEIEGLTPVHFVGVRRDGEFMSPVSSISFGHFLS